MYQKLLNHLILNQKDRLNFNLGVIKATVDGDIIAFDSDSKKDILIQAIKQCEYFTKTFYKDEDDFENTRSIGCNTAEQVLHHNIFAIAKAMEKGYSEATVEFLGYLIWFLEGDNEEEINNAWGKVCEIKRFKNFKK
jgi:hypothetical protein